MRNLKNYVALFAIIPILFYFWPVSLGGDTEFISVNGESMLPTIEHGAFAILKKDVEYKIGDIVAYNQHEAGLSKVVIHRIVGDAGKGSFILKGDNNMSNDPEPVKSNQIIGKLLFHVPYMGYLPVLLKNPLVLVLTMMGLALIAMMEKKRTTNKNDVDSEDHVTSSKSHTKKKKEKGLSKTSKQISLLVPALVVNMAYYVLGQYSISVGKTPQDGYNIFLMNIFDPYLAGTIVFSSWFGAIMASYIISRYSIGLESKKSSTVAHGTVQMDYRRLISFKPVAQLFWMIFTGLYGLYMFVLISNL